MKVLSLLEPWASLIKEKVKYIETRSWSTKYRGELYIHASKKQLTKNNLIEYKKQLDLLDDTNFKYGYIIAKCNLLDCKYMDEKLINEVKGNHKEYICGGYEIGRYAWMLNNIEMLENPIPVKGQLGIWNYKNEKEDKSNMEKHELVDINGNKTGRILTHIEVRDLDNIPNGYYIPVVGVVIINEKNEVLFQKRSKFKRSNPNKWGICGGKVDLNETTIDAALRETSEEIGIMLNRENFKILSVDTNEKMHFTVYYIRQNIDINECKIQIEELEEVRYFKIEEIEELDNEGLEWLENLRKIIYQ